VFSLLDAASFVSTAPLDVSRIGPDFVALSFYKIFGFPDLGALIVRKDAVHALDGRKFFGGGTVDMVIASGDKWHARKKTSIHDRFEDGTLPFHNIIALGVALGTHERLYGSMANVSVHTGWLAKEAFDRLSTLRHFNGTEVCQIYRSEYGNPQLQGPIIAFNLQNSRGDWIPKTGVEKLAATRDIQLRSGSVCNPGGTASSLGWTYTDLRRLYTAGLRCGDDHDVLEGRPTGVLRVSLGAMTSLDDIQALVDFIRDTYVEYAPDMNHLVAPLPSSKIFAPQFFVEALTVFPIFGCGGFSIPMGERWEIHENGLAWNHAWCLVHETTNEILESHTYPRMLKIRATVQLNQHVLQLSCPEWTGPDQFNIKISLPVAQPNQLTMPIAKPVRRHQDILHVQKYDISPVKTFFWKVLGVPCTLAMFCSQGTSQTAPPSRLDGTYRSRLQNLFRQKASWSRLSCIKSGSNRCSSLYAVENCTPIAFRSSVQCESVASSSEAEKENLIKHSVARRESCANIMLGEQTTRRSTKENSPFTRYDWSAIRIGPNQVQLDSMPDGGSKGGSFKGSVISKFMTVSIRQLNGRIEKYEVRSAEEDNTSRRTIAAGDVILPVG
jgi:molybdenum cofactor sulfurtransferase